MSIVLDGTTGITTPGLTNTGTETLVNLTTTGNTILGDASTDTLNVGNGGLVKDASGNVGIGTSSPTFGLGTGLQIAGAGYAAFSLKKGSAGTGHVIDMVDSSNTLQFRIGTNFASGGNNLLFAYGTTPTIGMTMDTSGNLGLGVTPSGWASSWRAIQLTGTSGNSGGSIYTNAGGTTGQIGIAQNWYYNGTNNFYLTTAAASDYYQYAGTHVWRNAPSGTAGTAITFTQAMTLDSSGNLIVAGTGAGLINNNSQQITASGYLISNHVNGTSSGSVYVYFGYNGSSIGSITQNGTTGVLYNLTSDYRLKNDQQALTGAKDFIMALKPKKWQWWDGSGEGVGFVAHEFMEVAKYSGNGEKDAVDADGKPVYQSIQPSSSEVMANLVAFIQEQQAIIQSLTDRITALENK